MGKRLNINEYIGKTYGFLTVLEDRGYHVTKGGTRKSKVLVKCVCGVQKEVVLNQLKQKRQKSCGCKNKPDATKHSKSNTLTYRTWQGMKTRCGNKNSPQYKYYGAIGISYDPRWEVFENFLEDMGERPEKLITLDRINPFENYSKENCRWADKKNSS